MSNFGVNRLRLVNPYAAGFREARCPPWVPLTCSARQKNSTARLPMLSPIAPWSSEQTAARNRALQQPVRLLDEAAGSAIRNQFQSERVALLFGSEKIGLTNKDFSHCHWLLNIPTSQQNLSMNLGQAVAVCLYELARRTPLKPVAEDFKPATAGEAEQITEGLLEAAPDQRLCEARNGRDV